MPCEYGLRGDRTNTLIRANITRSLASDFMHEQRKARAPAIAVLASHGKALFVNQENKKDAASSIHNHTSSLLDEGKKYYDQFSHQAGCASELEDLLSKLPDELRREFIAYIKSRNEAVSGLLELKEVCQRCLVSGCYLARVVRAKSLKNTDSCS